MIQVSNLSKSYGSRVLFEEAGFSLSKGDRVGFVGRNGSGKSTLFKILLDLETKDSGEIITPKGYSVGYLDQHIHFTEETVVQECCKVLPEEFEYEYYRAEKLLFGLGFKEEDLYKPPGKFSGGYQLRINLVKCLLQEPDLLLLDEPTNYLDILSLRWMKKFLRAYKGEIIIITHDRGFMDEVVTHTMGISRKKLKKIEGNTEKFYLQIGEEELIYEKTRQNQEKQVKNLQKFVDRFGAKASKASQAQSIVKKISKIAILDKLSQEQKLGFKFKYKPNPAKVLLRVNDLGFGYDENELLFKDLSFEVKATDRIAIIGKNGKGKTTLLNVLADQFKPVTGSYTPHPQAKVGYYQQTNRKDLDPNSTIVEEISSANTGLGLSEARGICGAVMFPGSDADKKISVLSGGEQGRVLLGKVIANPSNLLFLDEPSNHLDMESIEILTEQINEFPGGVVFVTHNEDMLRGLATQLIIFRKESCEVFLGNYDEFLEKVGWDEEEAAKPKKAKKPKNNKKKSNKNKIEQIEAQIQDLEKQVESNSKEASEKALSGDSEKSQELYVLISSQQNKIETLFYELSELSE